MKDTQDTGRVRLDHFSAAHFERGASRLKEALWVGLGAPVLACWLPGSRWRAGLLRIFGARIGCGTVWKPRVRVKFPWRLSVGDHSWIGEAVWIDNLAPVAIGDHVCISQGAYLCTGNHDWSAPSFDLIESGILLKRGVWIGARALVMPGSHAEEGAVLAAGSVGSGRLEAFTIYRGNPAVSLRPRRIKGAHRPDQAVGLSG